MSRNTKGCSGNYDSSDDNTPSNNISVVSTAGNSLDLIDDSDVGMHGVPDYDASESIKSVERDTGCNTDIQSAAFGSDNHVCIP